ncbi:MAG: NADH-quinone oxidoreductase subunit L [Actinomycetota bacterium]
MVTLIPALPLGGALILLLFRDRLGRYAGWFASATVAASFALSVMLLGEILSQPADQRHILQVAFEWISVGSFRVPMSFRVDPLTVVMLLVVTGIGALIHIYSIGYMAEDPRQATFFGYLNLFAASMLILVLGANFLVLFLGWELVGLCSYLLIGFWNFKPAAAAAGKKAFLVNRVGDLGFLVALFLIFDRFGTLDMVSVFDKVAGGAVIAAAVPVLLLIGATGKSAQIPLYVWLPDAMEGPTPVSALIHAATMVTAGVYLVARAHVLFESSTLAGGLVVGIGIATAFLAATIAMAQDDIKRVLAYSTISQLGYMFIAMGVGALTGSPIAYVAGIFHLVTHAVFKSLLFLGAGSVMHATADTTDMKKMGGLLRHLPITGITFIVGWLAISGIPPLAGFFSKESILAAAWEGGFHFVWFAAVVVSGLTAFYMSRQVLLTFFGKSRLPADAHPHESPETMTIVLRSLALLAVFAGAINLGAHSGALSRFLGPVFSEGPVSGGGFEHGGGATPFGLPEWIVSAFVVSVSVGAIFFAHRLYLAKGAEARRLRINTMFHPVVSLAQNKYYVDELYNLLLVWPSKIVARLAASFVDTRVIDGAVNGLAGSISLGSSRLRRIQTGLVRRYVMAMFAGAVVVVALLVVRVR